MAARKTAAATASNARRNPRQERSQERVDAILAATSKVIAEEGTAALKMAAIAKQAGVTTGSIYQYFPNVTEIVRALAERYAERFREVIRAHLQQVNSTDDVANLSHLLFDEFYHMYRSEPVLKEIGLATSLDKSLQEADVQDSRLNAALLFDAYSDQFPQKSWPELQRMLFLICHLSGSTIRLALSLEEEEVEPLLDSYRRMIEARFNELVRS